jgi:hypothetical protein
MKRLLRMSMPWIDVVLVLVIRSRWMVKPLSSERNQALEKQTRLKSEWNMWLNYLIKKLVFMRKVGNGNVVLDVTPSRFAPSATVLFCADDRPMQEHTRQAKALASKSSSLLLFPQDHSPGIDYPFFNFSNRYSSWCVLLYSLPRLIHLRRHHPNHAKDITVFDTVALRVNGSAIKRYKLSSPTNISFPTNPVTSHWRTNYLQTVQLGQSTSTPPSPQHPITVTPLTVDPEVTTSIGTGILTFKLESLPPSRNILHSSLPRRSIRFPNYFLPPPQKK